MSPCTILGKEAVFSAEAIHEQAEKILRDPLFIVSDILKRFLLFIVQETLDGRCNQLKEYTIAVAVLHKPADFKPQHDAIVRIHAGRLRRALHHYYEEAGKTDPIYISVPTGSYVPVFTGPHSGAVTAIIPGPLNNENAITARFSHEMVVGVMPFACSEKDGSGISFTEVLAAQLSTELSHIKNVSVIACYTMQRLAEKKIDINELVAAVAMQYVVTGDIQYLENRLRINIQMINAVTGRLLFSGLYERKLTPLNIFEVQDSIVTQVIFQFENYFGCSKQKKKATSLIAVA